jgi:hypothetical protein
LIRNLTMCLTDSSVSGEPEAGYLTYCYEPLD